MKKTLLILGAACALAFSGCANLTSQAKFDVATAVGQTLITNTVPAVLDHNPAYEPALVAVANGVDLVFAKGTLTPEDVNSYLALVAGKYAMDAGTRALIGGAILDLYSIYTKSAGTQIASVTDPKFAALLTAFRDGVNEGIRRYHAFHAAPPVASNVLGSIQIEL